MTRPKTMETPFMDLVLAEYGQIQSCTEVHGAGRGLLRLSAGEVMWALERMSAGTEWRGECWGWTGYLRNGYGTISIRNSPVYMHSLTLAIALGRLPSGYEACHTCDYRPCWRPTHLFAGTRRMNIMDARSKGRMPNPPRVTGARHQKATLTDSEVDEIRALWAAGVADQRALAAAYGVSQSTVWRFIHHATRIHDQPGVGA